VLTTQDTREWLAWLVEILQLRAAP
jgi:hypothetical protein